MRTRRPTEESDFAVASHSPQSSSQRTRVVRGEIPGTAPPPRHRRLSPGPWGLAAAATAHQRKLLPSWGFTQPLPSPRPASGLQITLRSDNADLASQIANQDRPQESSCPTMSLSCAGPSEPGPDCVSDQLPLPEALGPLRTPWGAARLPLHPHCTSGTPRTMQCLT